MDVQELIKLRARAKYLGITGYISMTAKELSAAIKAAERRQ